MKARKSKAQPADTIMRNAVVRLLGKRWGICRHTAFKWLARPTAPKPVAQFSQVAVFYDRATVERWVERGTVS